MTAAPPPNNRKTVLQRIQAKVEIDPVTGCWLWRGAVDKDGYVRLRVGAKKVSGHRALWIELHGPLERHQHVCHRCDRPACCNPGHLFVATHRENMADMVAKGRQSRGELRPRARLTAKLVRAIRADPRLQRVIAADYGLTPAYVSDIQRRVRWTHVP